MNTCMLLKNFWIRRNQEEDYLIEDLNLMIGGNGKETDLRKMFNSKTLQESTDLQAAIDAEEIIQFNCMFFDNRSSPYSTGSIAGSGGTHTHEFDIGAFKRGMKHVLFVEKIAGASDDITIQIYDSNPVTGTIIYEVSNFDIDASNIDDRNVWFLEWLVVNSLWIKIINDGLTAVTLNVGLRIKGE